MSHDKTLPPGHFHHFEPEQAYQASKLGMWIFLATEVHLFGGMFCAFAYYRYKNLEMFVEGGQALSWQLGALNTAVLLISSYFMVRAVDAAQRGMNQKVIRWCDLTLLCGVMFMVVKGIEYASKLSHDPPIYPSENIFYGLYFTMTGVHALHVIVGLGLIIWVRGLAKKKLYSETYYTPAEMVGLYWHLVDVIWIYLFPALYLMSGFKFGSH